MRPTLFLCLVALCISAAAQEVGEHPTINKAATAKFVILANVPDCMTAFVERGDPSSGALCSSPQDEAELRQLTALAYLGGECNGGRWRAATGNEG